LLPAFRDPKIQPDADQAPPKAQALAVTLILKQIVIPNAANVGNPPLRELQTLALLSPTSTAILPRITPRGWILV
jgi:hypothetical protein